MGRQKLIHLHAGKAGKPAPSALELGEIAVNYTAGSEKLYIKNNASSPKVVGFVNDNDYRLSNDRPNPYTLKIQKNGYDVATYDGTEAVVANITESDTKNTAGTTNTKSKIFLAGATEQAANPVTYSNSKCYAYNDYLYSNGQQIYATDGSAALNWGSTTTLATVNGVTIDATMPAKPSYPDTKNTTGTTNTTSKIFLAGATEQAANPVTYSNAECYASGGYLYSKGQKVSTTDNNPTLSWGTKSKVANVNGVDIHVTMPGNPNTDDKCTESGHYNPFSTTPNTAAGTGSALKGISIDSNGHVTGVTSTSTISNATNSDYINGKYTSNGGAQYPKYIPNGKVRWNMMRLTSTYSNLDTGSYVDFQMADTYSGDDVPYVTLMGVTKAKDPEFYFGSGDKGGEGASHKWTLKKVWHNTNLRFDYGGSGKNYPVKLNDNHQAYVNVPWTAGDDTHTTYDGHYNPGATGQVSVGGGSASVGNGTTVITNVTRDGKGHVTSVAQGTMVIPSIPATMPNPHSLTIQKNGVNVAVYDGSSAQTANITVPTPPASPDVTVSNSGSGFVTGITHGGTKGHTLTVTKRELIKEDLPSHTHPWSDITGEPAYCTRWPSWSEVTSKPSLMPIGSLGYTGDLDTKKTNEVFAGYDNTNSPNDGGINNYISLHYSPDWGSQLCLSPGDTRCYVRFWRDSGGKFTKNSWKRLAYASEIPSIPATMPNPHSLTIQKNGVNVAVYDGSSAQTANITVPDISGKLDITGKAADSDKLDGHDSTYFAAADKYLPLSGGTLTGDLFSDHTIASSNICVGLYNKTLGKLQVHGIGGYMDAEKQKPIFEPFEIAGLDATIPENNGYNHAISSKKVYYYGKNITLNLDDSMLLETIGNYKPFVIKSMQNTPIVIQYNGPERTFKQVFNPDGITFDSAKGVKCNGGFFDTSDARLKNFKEDIPIDFDTLKNIPKKYFTWKNEEMGTDLQIGTSAQEVQKIYPELVRANEKGELSVSYEKLSIVALKAVDELHDENEKLKKEMEAMKSELDMIKSKLGL